MTDKPEIDFIEGPAPTELQITDLIEGDGAEAVPGGTVDVHYVGVEFDTGEQFDASWDRGQSANFPLPQLIPAWQQGIPGMKVGGLDQCAHALHRDGERRPQILGKQAESQLFKGPSGMLHVRCEAGPHGQAVRTFMELRLELLRRRKVRRGLAGESTPRCFKVERQSPELGDSGVANEAWVDQPRELYAYVLARLTERLEDRDDAVHGTLGLVVDVDADEFMEGIERILAPSGSAAGVDQCLDGGQPALFDDRRSVRIGSGGEQQLGVQVERPADLGDRCGQPERQQLRLSAQHRRSLLRFRVQNA